MCKCTFPQLEENNLEEYEKIYFELLSYGASKHLRQAT